MTHRVVHQVPLMPPSWRPVNYPAALCCHMGTKQRRGGEREQDPRDTRRKAPFVATKSALGKEDRTKSSLVIVRRR